MLVDVGWCWLVLVGVARCCVMLADVGLKMVVYAGTGGDGPGAVSANI